MLPLRMLHTGRGARGAAARGPDALRLPVLAGVGAVDQPLLPVQPELLLLRPTRPSHGPDARIHLGEFLRNFAARHVFGGHHQRNPLAVFAGLRRCRSNLGERCSCNRGAAENEPHDPGHLVPPLPTRASQVWPGSIPNGRIPANATWTMIYNLKFEANSGRLQPLRQIMPALERPADEA